jgi:hypothetical protein
MILTEDREESIIPANVRSMAYCGKKPRHRLETAVPKRATTELDEPDLLPIIEAKFDVYVKRIINRIKRLPKECCLSGDDSPLWNVWEEWIAQMQREHSFAFDAYEETIRLICRGIAKSLPREEQGLLWIGTDDYLAWEEDDIPYGDIVTDALEEELYKRVCTAACNVELTPRLERYIFGIGED